MTVAESAVDVRFSKIWLAVQERDVIAEWVRDHGRAGWIITSEDDGFHIHLRIEPPER